MRPVPLLRPVALPALAFVTIAMAGLQAAAAGEMRVEVRNVDAEQGQLLVAVFDRADAWLKQPLRGLRLDARRGVVSGTFGDLPPGEYALSVVHDLNGNGRLDSNVVGIPTEPYAFSNKATGSFGPANFEQAKITVGATGATVVLELNGVIQ